MRTTISLDDQLAVKVRKAAASSGLSVSTFVVKTLENALKRPEPLAQPPFHLITVSGIRPLPHVDLDRPRALQVQEDVNRYRAEQTQISTGFPGSDVAAFAPAG